MNKVTQLGNDCPSLSLSFHHPEGEPSELTPTLRDSALLPPLASPDFTLCPKLWSYAIFSPISTIFAIFARLLLLPEVLTSPVG